MVRADSKTLAPASHEGIGNLCDKFWPHPGDAGQRRRASKAGLAGRRSREHCPYRRRPQTLMEHLERFDRHARPDAARKNQSWARPKAGP